MYISINLSSLRFLHKHNQRRVVTQLVTLEAPHLRTSIICCGQAKDFEQFTDYELRKLYENTTGIKFLGYFRPGLVEVAFAAAQSVAETDVIAWEVDLQLLTLSAKDRKPYLYVKGATRPKPVDELFDLPELSGKVSIEAVNWALTLKAAIIHTPCIAPPPPCCPDRTPAAPRVQQPVSASAAPRGAGRERIWACADAIWETAGKPLAIPKVLELRKQMMIELEKEGFKRNSVSCELGNWQKSRVLSAIN